MKVSYRTGERRDGSKYHYPINENSGYVPKQLEITKLEPRTLDIDWDYVNSFHEESQQRVFMSPREYLELVPGMPFGAFDHTSLEKIGGYGTFQPPFLDVNVDEMEVINHDGRHRAKWAYDNGIEQIPVILFHKREYPTRKSDGEGNYYLNFSRTESKYTTIDEPIDYHQLKPQNEGTSAWRFVEKVE